MRPVGWIFWIGAAFYAVVTAVYYFFTKETIGSILLLLTGGMAVLIAFYLMKTIGRLGRQPEDDPYGEQDEVDPDYGFYSPHSWWPFPIALASALTGAGLIYARWMVALGAVVLVMAMVGLVFEYTPMQFVETEDSHS